MVVETHEHAQLGRHASSDGSRQFVLSTLTSSLARKLPYKYVPLKDNEIRLLKLYPGEVEAPICCSLHVVDLLVYDDVISQSSIQGLERYDAVSYVWGNRKHKVRIICDGRTALITANLADALRTFRDLDQIRVLWADALCINQKDNRERAVQVQHMGLVYWKAHRVRVWLGRDDDLPEMHRARRAIELIRMFSHLYKVCSDFERESRRLHSERLFDESQNIMRPEGVALRCLLERTWFNRVWCVQELGLSRAVIFQCGNSHFTNDELDQFVRLLQSSRPGWLFTSTLNFQMLELGKRYYSSTRGGGRIELGSDPKEAETLFDILDGARGLSCTDPRDTIYAFLGHPSAFKQHILDVSPYYYYTKNYYTGKPAIISPNYDKSNTFPILCTELAISAVRDFEIGLQVLSHVTHNGTSIDSDIPSWVPRWDVLDQTSYFYGSESRYAASGNLESTLLTVHIPMGSTCASLLSLLAMRLSTISFSHHQSTHRSVRTLAENLFPERVAGDPVTEAEFRATPGSLSFPRNSINNWSAFAQTLTAGLATGSDLILGPADEDVDRHTNRLEAYLRSRERGPPQIQSTYDDEEAELYSMDLGLAGRSRVFYITSDGHYGLAPLITQKGDEVWLPLGAKMPFILRPLSVCAFKIVGQTYLHGIMKGEAVEGKSKRNFRSVVLY